MFRVPTSIPFDPRRRRERLAALFCLVFLAWIPTGCHREKEELDSSQVSQQTQPRRESFRTKYKALLRNRNYEAAERLIVTQLTKRPEDTDTMILAARLSVMRNRFDEADERFEAATQQAVAMEGSDSAFAQEITMERTLVRCKSGDIMKAVASLKALPYRSAKLTRLLAQLQTIIGDVRGATQQYDELLAMAQIEVGEVYQLACEIRRPHRQPEMIAAARKRYPDDLRPQLSDVVNFYEAGEEPNAIELLKSITQQHPDYQPAVGWLAFLLADNGLFDELQETLKQTDTSNWQHPALWYGWGILQLDSENFESAAASLAKAVELEPHGHLYASKLAVALGQLKEPNLTQPVSKLANLTQKLRLECRTFSYDTAGSQTNSVRIAQSLLELGRTNEALRWLDLAASLKSDPYKNFASVRRDLRRKAQAPDVGAAPLIEQLASRFDLSLEKPASLKNATKIKVAERSKPDQPVDAPPILLVDEATERGLDFVYDHGEPDQALGRWIYQTTGGGFAVGDFDLDGWQDLFFAQAGGKPKDKSRDTPDASRDQLYWNHSGQFQGGPVQGIPDLGYGQGVAVGDINDDGFPDVFVGNIGANQLLLNRGDGTFVDITKDAGLYGTGWTSSVAIVDLTNDGHADLVEINYCDSENALDKACRDKDGEVAVCVPVMFPGSIDRLWVSNGDGTFWPDDSWDNVNQMGRGLGLIIANLDSQPDLEVFVSNDMSSNHLWKKQPDGSWRDEAITRGLAVGSNGRPQACMGIAWADLDSDEDLDFIVTNYSNESNAFYVQSQDGFFIDRASSTGINDLSFPMLGFGTAMADLNQDGLEDLFVANGRVTRNEGEGEPFKQPAQVLSWDGWGRWTDASPEGDYFSEPHTGRAVAMADLDRDSRTDLVVGHLGEPTSLLMGRSKPGRSFSLELIATRTARDAVGAIVTLTTNRRTRTLHRTGGHGYYVTHETALNSGLAPDEVVENVSILWPSGITETLPTSFTETVDLPHLHWTVVENGPAWRTW